MDETAVESNKYKICFVPVKLSVDSPFIVSCSCEIWCIAYGAYSFLSPVLDFLVCYFRLFDIIVINADVRGTRENEEVKKKTESR